MASKVYECKFSSEKGERYIFELWDLEVTGYNLVWGTGAPYIVDIAKGGISVDYSGDINNPMSPIITSTCTVELVIRNAQQQRIIDNIPLAHDYQIACKIYRVIDGVSEPYWYGLLTPEQITTDIGPWPIGCELTFTDGLALLRDQELSDSDGNRLNRGFHLRGYIGYCLSKLPHFSIFWGATEDMFYSMSDLSHADHVDSGTIYDPLRYSHIHSDVFYIEREQQNEFGRGFYTKETRATAYDVIEDIMIAFGMRFMHSGGKFYAYSPVLLREPSTENAALNQIRYKNDRRAMDPDDNFAFSESEQDDVTGTVSIENNLSASYVVESGSKRTFLPPIKRAILTHKNGGSQRIFPNTDIFYVDWKWFAGDDNHILRYPLSSLGDFESNVPIDVFSPDAPTAMFGPVEVNSDNFDLVIPEGLGFTLVGTMEATFWSPDMSDAAPNTYFRGGRPNEMLGAKPVVRMKLRVGNYYLKQTLRQTTAADFPTNSVMQNSNWGEINIGAQQIGVPAGNRQFYPLVVDDLAQWTTDDTATFDFSLIQPGFVGTGASGNPEAFIEVPTIAYREINAEGDVEETRYPVGLYLKLEDGGNNNNDTTLRYSTQSLNLWGGALSADPPITVLSLPIRLEIPPLPAQAGDQSEVEIDFSVYAYSAEGTLQPDTVDTTIPYTAASNAHHVQNVFHPHNPRIRNFNLYAGSDDEDSDVIYSSQLSGNYEVVDVGETTIGSKVTERGFNTVLTTQSAPAQGGGSDVYQQEPDWNSYHLTETDDDLLQLTVHTRTLLQGVPQQVLDLSLIAMGGDNRPGEGAYSVPYMWQRLMLTLDGTEYAMIPLNMSVELSTARLDVVGLVYDTAATYNPGGDPVSGKNLLSYGRAQSTVQATGDGSVIDNKGPEPGTGGGITPADQLKLDAITMNGTGDQIIDFDVASAPLNSDEVDDSTATHKFVTQSELNTIASTSASVNDILSVFKETTTGDGAGVYVNTSATDESHVSVTSTTGKLQAGARTNIDMTETSPGQIDFNVQSGAAGSEVQSTAISIVGNSSTPLPTTTINSVVNHSRDWNFTNSGSTVTFTAGTSGIDYNDLDNTPPSGLANVVDDTTPQLGGNLDVNSNEIQSNGDLVVRVDADNNTTNSSFIVKNGAGLNMLTLDEEGMTSITTGADNPLKLGNLDGGTSTFNCVSLNGNTAYPGLIGFAAGANSNDNFFMMGEIIDLRPDTSNPISGAIRLQADPNNSGESVCTINHRSGSEPTTHSLAVKGTALISDDVDLSAALDVTGTLTASGLTYPTSDGTSGQVLSTDGSGTLAFTSLPTTSSIYKGIGLDGNGTGVFVGSGTLAFQVGDLVAHTGSTSKGIWACNTSFNFQLQSNETQATSEWLVVFSYFDHIGAPAGLSLSDLESSPSSGTFSDSLSTFSLTASSSISFNALATLIGGAMTQVGGNFLSTGNIQGANLSTAGTLTASGLTYPSSDGSSGQVITTDGNGTLSFTTVSGGGGGGSVQDIDDLGDVDTSTTSPSIGDVLEWDGTNWVPTVPSGGGYSGPIPLTKISGRWMWSSTDDFERVLTGQTAYGPYNFYSHSQEPSTTTIRVYSASHVVDSTSATMPAYYNQAFGVDIPTTDKKVKCLFTFRIQNAPAGSNWGVSLWSCPTPTQGTTAQQTFTLRGVSSSVSVGTNTQEFYTTEFTTTSDIAGGYILPMLEHRTTSLPSTTYIYGQIALYLVD